MRAGMAALFAAMGLIFSSCLLTLTPPSQTISHLADRRPQVTNEIKDKPSPQSPVRVSREERFTLMSDRVRAIAADDRYVCVGTDRGISLLDRAENRWRHYTIPDGLSSDSVNDILIDGGYIWIATDRGVSRLDLNTGQWRNFDTKDGLLSDRINCIASDGDYIWFGTDGGLNRYDKRIDSWAARTSKDGLSSDRITAIAVTDEYVWIGSSSERWSMRREERRIRRRPNKGGVDRYDKATDSWTRYSKSDGLAEDEITSIAVDEESVWFGTFSGGISVYSKTDQAFVRSFTQSDLLTSNYITDITVDGNQIWIATANAGVQRYIKSVNTWINYTVKDGLSSDHVTCIFVHRNEVWFGTYEDGVTLYDKTRNTWTVFRRLTMLPGNRVADILRGDDGSIWAATDEGVGVFDGGSWRRYGRESGLPSNFVTAITSDGERIWLGTDTGFGRFSGGRWAFFTGNGRLKDKLVTDILVRGKNGWLGTRSGLYRFDPNRPEESLSPIDELGEVRVNGMSLLPDGELMAFTEVGLWLIGSSPRRMLSGYVNDAVVADDLILVGTRDGLKLLDRDGNLKGDYHSSDGLPNENVTSLAYDEGRGIVWIGTPTGPAAYDLKTGQISRPIDSVLAKCNVRKIAVYDGKLWIGTYKGLFSVDPDSGGTRRYMALPRRDLLKTRGAYFILMDGDDVWFSNWYRTHDGAIFRVNRRNWVWRSYTRQVILNPDEEMAISRVSWIAGDEREVWFATDGGALRYDKVKDIWRLYTIRDGLVSNMVDKIAISRNSVWVIFMDGPIISRFDRKEDRWETIIPPETSGLPFEDVESIVPDGDQVWIALSMSGIRRYNEETGEWRVMKVKDGLASDRVHWLAVDDRYVWIAYFFAGTVGLSRYDKSSGQFHHYSTSDVLADPRVDRVYAGKEGVWILYHNWRSAGATRYDRRNDEWLTITPKGEWGSGVVELAEDGDYLWLATAEEGVKRYHLTSGTWTSFDVSDGLADNEIFEHSLKVDERYVWVGTERGLSVYDKETERWISYTMREKLPDREVFAVAADKRFVWVGTKSGLSRYDKLYDEWRIYRRDFGWWFRTDGEDFLVDNSISSLAVDDRYVWIGTREGANRYDKVADIWLSFRSRNGLPSEDITSIAVDGYDIWMGTNGGLCKYPRMSDNPNAWVTYTSGVEIKPMLTSKRFANTLVSDEVWCIAVDDRYVWVGTQRGVSRYDKGKDIWDTFTREDGLVRDAVADIAVHGDEVWFGTSGGISVYDKRSQDWVTYTSQNGLPSDNVTCLTSDGRFMWIGTFDAGLVRFDPQTKSWRRFTRQDGLAHNSILSITVDGDLIWVGTQDGLSRYDSKTDSWTSYRAR
jgi:ligand-binding sensor domain-containing protein